MEELATTPPVVQDEDAPRVLWTAQLEVFDQDFDTAMAIWSMEDAVVERLYVDEQPVTRRRSNLSSSQIEFSQLSDSSQRESRGPRGRKRRRATSAREGDRDRSAPLPPFSSSSDYTSQTEEVAATQSLLTQGVDLTQSWCGAQGDTQDVSVHKIFAAREESQMKSTPSKRGSDVGTFKTPASGRRSVTEAFKSSDSESSFSQADVVRESPLESSSVTIVDKRCERFDDGGTDVCSGFSTGSGKIVMVSRKRMREVEASWLEEVAHEGSVSFPDPRLAPPKQACLALPPDINSAPISNIQNSATLIDPRRLSFSATEDDAHPEIRRRTGFQTGSGRILQPNQATLSKYEALLFADHVGHADTNEGLVPKSRSVLHARQPTSIDTASAAPDMAEHDLPETVLAQPTQVHGAVHDAAGSRKAITGFRTGAGRQVAVSRDRLSEYADTMFNDTDNAQVDRSTTAREMARPPTPPQSFGTAASAGTKPTSGFQTASGRAVEISQERLQEIEDRLFGGDHPAGSTLLQLDSVPIHRAPTNQTAHSVKGPHSATSASPRGLPVERTDIPTVPSGFQSGSGARIRVSQERLRQYEQTLGSDGQDSVLSQGPERATGESHDTVSTRAVLTGFSTGSGGKVSVSKESLRLYEKLSSDEGNFSVATTSPTIAKTQDPVHISDFSAGFVTARGDQVVMSEDKLQLYARMFAEGGGDAPSPLLKGRRGARSDSSCDEISGFTTGTGRQITISEEKLREYREKLVTFEDGDQDQTGSGPHQSNSEKDAQCAPRQSSATESVDIVAGFSTGRGLCVSVSERTIRDYQEKSSPIVNGVSSDSAVSEDGVERVDVKHAVGETRDTAHSGISLQHLDGRPPRHRHSIGSRRSSGSVESTNRRHSLPPRAQAPSTYDSSSVSVSSRVIQRMAIANQRNIRSTILVDVSDGDAPKSRSRGSGLNSGGKWKPPSQLPNSQSAGYTTPAKTRSTGPQNLSAKKGFRPPVPLKTPPSKSLIKVTATPAKPAAGVPETKLSTDIGMRFHESMRISYKLLALESGSGSQSFTSESRVKLLRQIEPERAPTVKFSRTSGNLPVEGECNESLSMIDLLNDMKECGYFGNQGGVTHDWFKNQYRWVVWKLATLELLSPRFLFGRYLTKSQVTFEMCKRYQRDIVLAQRSIVKKILHRDANAASCMILRVAAVLPYPVEEEKDIDIIPPPHWKLAVVLTDGWHAVYAVPDAYLAEAFWKHHIAGRLVGKKIVTWSALLQNVADGIDPLECALATEEQWANPLWVGKDDPSKWPYLKLQFNSTRAVRADVRLGLESLVRPLLGKQSDAPYDFVMLKSVPMRTFEVGGGVVRSVCVRVTRISPILHLQSNDFAIGPRILCEEHMPQYFQARQEHLQGQRNEESSCDEESSSTLPLPVPFVKLEVECAHDDDSPRKCYAVLTVWRPGDELITKLKEGGKYHATNLSVNWKVDYGNLGTFMRIGTTKGSTFQLAELGDGDRLTTHTKVCETVSGLIERYQKHVMTMPKEKKLFGDVCVVIVRCEDTKTPTIREPDTSLTTSTEHVFVTDRSLRLMSIRIHSTRVSISSATATGRASDKLTARKKTTERLFTRGSKKLWTEGAVVCISGLEVSHYDEKLDILDCDLVESAQLVSLPSKKSHFFEDAQSLRNLLAGTRDAVDTTRDVLQHSVQALRKYVERNILHLEVGSSQDEADGSHTEEEEADHLTQDLQALPEDDVSWWMSQAPSIYTSGNVIRMLPLHPTDVLSKVFNAVAIAYVRSNSNRDEEDTLQALYLTSEIFEKTREFLNANSDGEARVCDYDGSYVGKVLRFESQWETSERLLNSWKPWERDGGATFLLATSVSTGSLPEDS